MLGGVLIDHAASNAKHWSWLRDVSCKITYKMNVFFEMLWTMLDALIDAPAFNAKPCAWLGEVCLMLVAA